MRWIVQRSACNKEGGQGTNNLDDRNAADRKGVKEMKDWLEKIHIDVEGMQYPIGIDQRAPVFHYRAEAKTGGKSISAYQIQVTGEDGQIAWDSGRTETDGTPYIVYAGEDLKAKTLYSVKLKLWDELGNESGFSEPCSFETGFFDTQWQAEWIEPVQEDAFEEKELDFLEMLIPTPEFRGGDVRLKECKNLRRKFQATGGIKKARLYASAHGIYQLYINGREVSSRRLAPETASHEHILYYQTYDVTGLLGQGENVVGAILADGWWIGRMGLAGDSCNYGKRLGFIMQLELEYTDGRRDMICSDGEFKSAGSHIRYSDLFIGEKQDLNQDYQEWKLAGFDDSAWENCLTVEADKKILTGQGIDPIVVQKEIAAKKIFYTPSRELVIDFGQVMAGVGRFEIEAAKGTEVTFEHSEVIDKNGNFKNNIIGRNKDQKDVLVCREGHQVFEPLFTYHGFRYVKITGIGKKQLLSAKALVMGTALQKIGSFSCSDERLNKLQHNIEWSTVSNMFSVPTDCPQREKLGWTGDIQVYTKTGSFNYDLKNFLEGWMRNVRADQNEDGEIPVVVPNLPKQERTQRVMSGDNSSAAWGDACVLVPYGLYLHYGDVQVLRDNFACMQRWLQYVKKSAGRKPEGYEEFTAAQKERSPYLWTKQYHFGDWLIPSLRALPDGVMRGTKETAAVVGSCYYAITVTHFIKVCEALGESKLAAEHRSLLKNIKKAVREEFVAEDGTVNNSALQGLYVIVLASGAVEGDLKHKVLEKLVTLIKDNDYCLDTGFASIPFLLDVLYDNGYPEVAYRLLFQTKAPSWLYMVQNGATSMWENWLAVLEDGTPTDSSYNHYAFGCVGDFIYRHIGGIQIAEPGYRKILFNPDLGCGLTRSKCEVISPYGRVALDWKLEGNKCRLRGEVPLGCSATLCVNQKELELSSGSFTIELEI
ncbi:MAG TPA: family 78 glycoside hydrolase catalytic domain [Clostridiales bacterium]|nr:family 78 glycoside hydrolase catalytic domain [Clostridiales bacterium]